MGGFVNSKDGRCSGLATKSSSRGKMRQVLPSDVVLTNIHSKSICVCSRDEGSCIFFFLALVIWYIFTILDMMATIMARVEGQGNKE